MDTPAPPSVTVTGLGSAAAPPDVMVVDVAAEATEGHAASALASAGAALTRMRDAALVAGVERADVASTGTQVWPEVDREGRPSGYRAVLGLSVRLRDLGRAGHLLADLVAAGGDQARLQGTRFEHADPAAVQHAAREAAFADARAKADQLASLAGRTLGPVLEVAEAREGGLPVPMRMAALAESIPVEAGTQAVSASVVVRWELV